MNKLDFRAFRSSARRLNQSHLLVVNGRAWAVGRRDCTRLATDGSWYIDRPAPAEIAMAIDSTGFMRRRFGILSTHSLDLARRIRTTM
jgi:hypothetical protein